MYMYIVQFCKLYGVTFRMSPKTSLDCTHTMQSFKSYIKSHLEVVFFQNKTFVTKICVLILFPSDFNNSIDLILILIAVI